VFKLPGLTLCWLAFHLALATPASPAMTPLVCPAGAPIGSVDLRVRPARGGPPLPLKTINRLGEGDTIVYKPLVRTSEKRKGEVAIVLIPTVRPADAELLNVLDPKPAGIAAEWQVPSRSSVVVFVYGPAGLNRAKVLKFLSKDDDLVTQLADYAEKTAQTEALLTALSTDADPGETMNAAFRGFASQYGAAQIDRTQPSDQQLSMAIRTLNPAVSSYDPILPQSSQRVGQTASLATSVAALFFGSPVGLAAGGTAMLMELHSIAFPNTVFRSSFAQPIPDDGLGLCGKRDSVPAHTKVAYLWATRVPNIGPPHVAIAKAETLPAGMKAPLTIDVSAETDWKYLDRARKWTLEPEIKGQKAILVPVHPSSEAKTDSKDEIKLLEIDLTKVHASPGKYHLVADWDWDSFIVSGDVIVAALSDFKAARMHADSQDRLIAKSGRIPVTLTGSDFEYVTKVEIAKPGDKFFTNTAVPFALPKGFRDGAQDYLDLQVNTIDLDPADYRLLITQVDGKTHPVPIAILPAPPKLDQTTILIHQGDSTSEFLLKGERLDRISSIKCPLGKVTLESASPDNSSRKASIHLDEPSSKGHAFPLKLYVENRSEPITIPDAIRIADPRATIISSRVSLPPESDVSLSPGELPSGYVLSAMLQMKGFGSRDVLGLSCRGDQEPRIRLRADDIRIDNGSQNSLTLLGDDSVFLTFDDTGFPSGCELLALPAFTAGTQISDGYSLGRIVHIPKIQSLEVASASPDDSGFEATLSGQDLETIGRVGWDQEHGTGIDELPSVVPGEGRNQTLRIVLPSGPLTPDVPLYVWLRGEKTGRATLMHVAGPASTKLKARVAAK
jgi:hypothetical protein